MKKYLYLTIVFNFGLLSAQAQIDPLYAQYLNNPLLINPAYTGHNNNFTGSVSYRKQWAGFDGSPVTYNVTAHSSFADNKMGAGLIILRDEIGANANTEVQATYSYKLDLQDKYLSFGLQGGVVSFKSNNGDINPYDPTDPIFYGTQNTSKPTIGAGIILSSERYFFGLSVPRMLKSKATFDDVEAELYSRHFYAMASYVIFLNERVRVKPSVLLKGVSGSPLSADVNVAFNFDEKYTAGAFTRNLNTYGLLAQMKLGDAYKLGYVFEVPTNNSVGSRFTSHEVTLTMNLKLFESQTNLISSF
jgi:type IX secretion system PorP/SprF family membrane protein